MQTTPDTTITNRAFGGHDDIARVRQFLFATYRLTRSGQNWEARRWEGKFYHDSETERTERLANYWAHKARLWETASGELVGVVHPEDDNDIWLQIHPQYRHLEDEMLAWGEAHLAKTNDAGQREVYATSLEGDRFREELLTARGYARTEWWAVTRWREMAVPVPPVVVPEGYTVRSIRAGNMDDLQRLANVIGAGFGREIPVEMLIYFEQSPSYNADLILVIEAPDGSFASHCGVTYNPETGFGQFEPVCTHPDHRRKGLARAVMTEGLHRLVRLGAERAAVGTGGTNTSNFVYAQLDFDHIERVNIWRKGWPAD